MDASDGSAGWRGDRLGRRGDLSLGKLTLV